MNIIVIIRLIFTSLMKEIYFIVNIVLIQGGLALFLSNGFDACLNYVLYKYKHALSRLCVCVHLYKLVYYANLHNL